MAKPANPRTAAATSARATGRGGASAASGPMPAGGRGRRGGRAEKPPFFSPAMRDFVVARTRELVGFVFGLVGLMLMVVLGSYHPGDPSWNSVPAGEVETHNLFGLPGAYLADLLIQSLGWASFLLALVPMVWGWRLGAQKSIRHPLFRCVLALGGVLLAAMALAGTAPATSDPLSTPPGGGVGKVLLEGVGNLLFGKGGDSAMSSAAGIAAGIVLFMAMGLSVREWLGSVRSLGGLFGRIGRGARSGAALVGRHGVQAAYGAARSAARQTGELLRREPSLEAAGGAPNLGDADEAPSGRRGRRMPFMAPVSAEDAVDAPIPPSDTPRAVPVVTAPAAFAKPRAVEPDSRPLRQGTLPLDEPDGYELPPLDLLQLPPAGSRGEQVDETALRRNAEMLEGVLADFGVRGEVQKVHPGPVVTLYELEPAPGTKSSRVIGLADDIARSMSAVSVRVAVVPGRNVIGIELPNARRETVLLRELMAAEAFDKNAGKLALALGKDIGGQPIVADLARFPHLLVAGTTGSGKSVAINTMILSLLYRLPPERCRFIMIDPKMLELSVYEGIPHLLTPVVTYPK